MRVNQGAAAMAMVVAAVLTSGCRVEKSSQGDGDNVKVATPFGGLSVKTDEATVIEQLGLPAYPGAVLVKKKENGKNDGAADVNLSFGSFQLRVKAATYRTDDSPDKVSAFYRKALGRYGDVIECQDEKPVGSPTRTAEGLACNDDKGNHVIVDDDLGKRELKAGSKLHQHIIGIDPDGSGTKIGMVALDLPGHLSVGSGDDDNKQ